MLERPTLTEAAEQIKNKTWTIKDWTADMEKFHHAAEKGHVSWNDVHDKMLENIDKMHDTAPTQLEYEILQKAVEQVRVKKYTVAALVSAVALSVPAILDISEEVIVAANPNIEIRQKAQEEIISNNVTTTLGICGAITGLFGLRRLRKEQPEINELLEEYYQGKDSSR